MYDGTSHKLYKLLKLSLIETRQANEDTSGSFLKFEFRLTEILAKMPGCCVPLCRNRSGGTGARKYSFHRFPACQEKRELWLKLIRREDFTPTANTRVCSWHFPAGFEAGPTRFHWNVSESTYADPMPLPSHFTRKKFRIDADENDIHMPTSAALSQSNIETLNSATQCLSSAEPLSSLTQSQSNTETLNSTTQSQSSVEPLSSLTQSQSSTDILNSVTQSKRNITKTLNSTTQSKRNTETLNSAAQSLSSTETLNSASQSQSSAETLNKDEDPVNPEVHVVDLQKERDRKKKKGKKQQQNKNRDCAKAVPAQEHIINHLGQYVLTQGNISQGGTLVFLPMSQDDFTKRMMKTNEQNARLKVDIERLKEKLSSQRKRKADGSIMTDDMPDTTS